MEPTGQQTAQPHPKMSIKVNRNLHYSHFLQDIATCNIIIGEWLRSPSDCFNTCFCVLCAAQILKVNSTPIISILLTINFNVTFIHSFTICEQQTKDYAPSGSFHNKQQKRCFYLDVCRLS